MLYGLQAQTDLDQFIDFVTRGVAADPHFLKRSFWAAGGRQLTFLNYLIEQHHPTEANMQDHIQHLLDQNVDCHLMQPLHLALALNKNDLALQLLDYFNRHPIAIDALDKDNHSLLSRAIASGDLVILHNILRHNPNVNQPTRELQALHEAAINNFHQAIEPLLNAGASIGNPATAKRETPLILAARYGNINALIVLARHHSTPDNETNPLDIENIQGTRAIDLLCKRLNQGKDPTDALQGIAVLLCHGASAPRNAQWRSLLQKHRDSLIDAVAGYTTHHPELRTHFVRAAHNKNDALHEIIYADRTFATSFGHFFGVASDTAFKLEALVNNVAETPQRHDSDEDKEAPNVVAVREYHSDHDAFDEDEQRFAEFVQRYDVKLRSTLFFNAYSEMRWLIARGVISTWGEVKNYCDDHPGSRSAGIRQEMEPMPDARASVSL